MDHLAVVVCFTAFALLCLLMSLRANRKARHIELQISTGAEVHLRRSVARVSARTQYVHREAFGRELGQVLAAMCEMSAIRLDRRELFFVKTGLCPYCHDCVDNFIPMLCPACEWPVHNLDLIAWRHEMLLKLERQGQSSLEIVPFGQCLSSPANQARFYLGTSVEQATDQYQLDFPSTFPNQIMGQ
jgi:hypothetical protein